LTELAEERLVTSGGKVQPTAIPAIGAALKGLRETTLQVNLRPEAQVMEGRAKRVSRLNGTLLLFFLLGLIIWGASYPIKDEIQLVRYERRIEKLGPSVRIIRRTEGEVNKLKTEVSMLAKQERRRGEALRLLGELSLIVPETAYLSILRIRDGNVELRGSADNASSLVPLLERSPLLKNVGFSAPTNRGRDNRETFSLKAEVER
jgi:general secretion pathway protein L